MKSIMDSPQGTSNSSFTNLAAHQPQQGSRRKRSIRGNIIKANQIIGIGTEKIEVMGSSSEQPKILIHREGEQVQGVEVCCTCGKITTVQFTYDGE